MRNEVWDSCKIRALVCEIYFVCILHAHLAFKTDSLVAHFANNCYGYWKAVEGKSWRREKKANSKNGEKNILALFVIRSRILVMLRKVLITTVEGNGAAS